MVLSKDQFLEWRNENPVSQVFFAFLDDQAVLRREAVSTINISKKVPFEEIGQAVYKALIEADYFDLVKNIQYEDLLDDEHTSSGTQNLN